LSGIPCLSQWSARGADDAMAQYQEHLDGIMQQQMAKFHEGRARREETEASKADQEGGELLRDLQATPYRTKDRDSPA
jgi:hypothetical protein